MRKLFATQLPRTLHDLQSLLGKLNFASQFVAHFKQLVAPLVALMGNSSDGQWLPAHTEVLNQLGEAVWKRMKLALCDTSAPARLHVDVDEEYCSVVLTQGSG